MELYAALNVPRHASDQEIAAAYKQLARVFHPDKQSSSSDPAAREAAQSSFAIIQEAYEVLSDPASRHIYDVYGREGLQSGMEVGPHFDPAANQPHDNERARRQHEDDTQEAQVLSKGQYRCQVDATGFVRKLHSMVPGGPAFDGGSAAALTAQLDRLSAADRIPHARAEHLKAQVVAAVTALAKMDHQLMTQELSYPLGDTAAVTMSGQVIMKRSGNLLQPNALNGGGTFSLGYTQQVTPVDTLEAAAGAGMRQYCSVASSRQVDPLTVAAVTVLWAADDGPGLQLSSSRHLWEGMSSTLTWVVGPPSVAGVNLGFSRQGTKTALIAKADLGALTGVSLKCSYDLSDSTALRFSSRFGTVGIDSEVGLLQKLTHTTSLYAGVVYGVQGTVIKVKVHRGHQTFEFPFIMSRDGREWRALLLSYTLPPALLYLTSTLLIHPLLRHQKRQREARALEERLAEVGVAVREATKHAGIIAPVALRKVRAEAAKQGLVVVKAVYGNLASYLELPVGERLSRECGVCEMPPSAAETLDALASSAPEADVGSEDGEEPSTAQRELPGVSPYLDVTAAVQFLIRDSTLTMHAGVPKHGLMGFADPAPLADKEVYLAYVLDGRAYQCTIHDTDSCQLPGRGHPIDDPALSSTIMHQYELLLQDAGC